MKLIIHLDGRREAEGTPDELREFEAAQSLHVGPPAVPWMPMFQPPCSCGGTMACAAHPFYVPYAVRSNLNACAGGINPAFVADQYGSAMRPVEWKPGNVAVCAGNAGVSTFWLDSRGSAQS